MTESQSHHDPLREKLREGALFGGKYRLTRRLGGGGMGEVWLGHHTGLDAPVAVKFMHPLLVEVSAARARFEREAKSAAQIRSPHVVHVYDHGIQDGLPYIVMEYLEGEDLGERLRRVGTLALADAVRIAVEVCKGLQRAHGLGIVHRDLKPGNVFLSAPDDDMVKILDFGIAKETGRPLVTSETTTTGQLLGSPHYMSPEQCRGMTVDGRSDLWSLGVIFFRAVTGRKPFEGTDIGDLIVRICVDPLPSVAELRPELGPGLDGFFARALDHSPDQRFQTARAFAEALLQCQDGDAQAWGEQARTSGRFPGPPSLTPASGVPAAVRSESGVVTAFTPTPGGTDERTPIEGTRTLTGLAWVGRGRRRWLIGGALATLLLGAGVWLTLSLASGHRGSPTAAAPAEIASPPPQAASPASAAEAPPPSVAVAADAESAGPGNEATADPKPPARDEARPPKARGRARPQPDGPRPPKKSDPELGY
jgi:eukaryotic-like serine/threonine-protein kinase